VDEVGRAVQRVDDPLKRWRLAAGACRLLLPGLLAQEGMLRIGRAQDLDDGLFGCTIDLGDVVARTLAGDLQLFQVEAGAVDDGACTPGRLDGGVEHGMHRIPYSVRFAATRRRYRPGGRAVCDKSAGPRQMRHFK